MALWTKYLKNCKNIMNHFKELLTSADEIIAKKSIQLASQELTLPSGVWVCVGSRTVGLAHQKSDIDLLYFSEHLTRFQRLSSNHRDIRISVCAAPTSYLRDDAYYGKYGGYFAAKLFNPRITIQGDDQTLPDITIAPFLYFYPFIQFLSKHYGIRLTDESVVAIAVVLLINMCPEYDAYFLKMFLSPKFSTIWKLLRGQFKESMVINKVEILSGTLINRHDRKLPELQNFNEFYRERSSRAACHWSFGVYTHNGNPNFYARYKEASRLQVEAYGGYSGKRYEEMVSFLLKKSMLPQLYI